MSWWAVDVRAAPGDRERIAAWLVGESGNTVEERPDGLLVGFALTEPEARALETRLHALFAAEVRVWLRPLESIDWTTRWREGLGPRQLGRLTLVPSWIAPPADSEVVLTLDPESAFGSGEHGSTRATLTLLERLLRPGQSVVDLGSGSGILAIAAAKLGAGHAFGIEIDSEAIPVAVRNAERNDVTGRVEFLEGDAAKLAPLCAPADLILSNILRGPNIALLPVIRAALAPDGIAIFSGMQRTETELFRPELERSGLKSFDEAIDDGWWAVAARRS
ncbi:MAG TPA: 50S ribosomal protein L11 methyltransferase [Gemmatimonadales bacterium]